MPNFKVRTVTRDVLSIDDGTEVELEYAPYCDGEYGHLQHKLEGNRLVVAYMVHDEDPGFNPMKDHDCNGLLYTCRERVITDNPAEVYRALGLTSYGEADLDRYFQLDGDHVTLYELADRELVACGEDPDEDGYGDRVIEHAHRLYSKHWEHLAGPWVLPVHYSSGRGETTIYPDTWDGDIFKLPSGVWVADKDVQDNIGKFDAAKLNEYATSTLQEYAQWCSGDVYGLVTEIFERAEPGAEWTQVKSDSCWGFIGCDFAKKALSEEYFTPHLNKEAA